MSLEGTDLTLANYTYDDLRDLFGLPNPYSREQWKAAGASILRKVHPDKSRLPTDYFRFFRAAHTLLGSLVPGSGSARRDTNEYYDDREAERARVAQSREDFAQWFNTTFEEVCRHEDDTVGHGDWLGTEDGCPEQKRPGEDVNAYFARCRASAKVPRQREIVAVASEAGGERDELGGGPPSSYKPALFGSLQYEDVREAHGTGLIPVDADDLQAAAGQSKTVQQCKAERSKAYDVASQAESAADMDRVHRDEAASSMRRRYELAAGLERASDMQRVWRGRLDALTDGK
jgi:hypothetical protein